MKLSLQLIALLSVCIVCAIWSHHEFLIVQSRGGFGAVSELAAVGVPIVFILIASIVGQWLFRREYKTALAKEHPIVPTETQDAVQVNAGGVKLSLLVDRTASGDGKFRESVVEMVKSALAVRGGAA